MRLTTRRRYAVTSMLDVALHQTKGPVSLGDVSLRQNISQSYLEQLFAKLRRNGLVRSIRGPGGGYLIGKDFANITVLEIINAIDEKPFDKADCKTICSHQEAHDQCHCLTRKLWSGLSKVMYDFLNSVTLADLFSEQKDSK